MSDSPQVASSGDDNDSCCPNMSKPYRITGFIVCAVIGYSLEYSHSVHFFPEVKRKLYRVVFGLQEEIFYAFARHYF